MLLHRGQQLQQATGNLYHEDGERVIIAGLAWDREFNRGVIAGRIDSYAKSADRLHEIWTRSALQTGVVEKPP